MTLVSKNILRVLGVHPVGREPCLIVLGITGSSRRQGAGQTHCGRGLSSEAGLRDAMGVVAADEEYLAHMIGDGCRAERAGGVAYVDRLDTTIGGQHRFKKDQIPVECPSRFSQEHPAEPEHHPVQV